MFLHLGLFFHTNIDITNDNFPAIKQKYLEGEDRCTEHYRWGAFNVFMQQNSKIDRESFSLLYDLGETDPDRMMGRSMLFDIVKHSDCPIELIDRAINEGAFTLPKHASECKAIRNRQ
jgi:hypothetical protein